MTGRTIVAAALLAASTVFAYAQTSQDQDTHHPSAANQPAPQPQAPTGTMDQGGMAQGMMGQGMMGQGMGQGGMMSGGMMTGMMGAGQTPTCSGGACGMGGMATIDHVEGRIAFLKTELKITDAQNDTWNAFADVLRNNAKRLGELRALMIPQGTLVDRMSWQEKWLTARAENTHSILPPTPTLPPSSATIRRKPPTSFSRRISA